VPVCFEAATVLHQSHEPAADPRRLHALLQHRASVRGRMPAALVSSRVWTT